MTRDEGHTARLPTPAQVEAMAGYGLSSADIAKVLDLEEDMLCTTYARELGSGVLTCRNPRFPRSRDFTGSAISVVTPARLPLSSSAFLSHPSWVRGLATNLDGNRH